MQFTYLMRTGMNKMAKKIDRIVRIFSDNNNKELTAHEIIAIYDKKYKSSRWSWTINELTQKMRKNKLFKSNHESGLISRNDNDGLRPINTWQLK